MAMADAPDSENVPADQAHLVMHAALTFGEDLLMASDDPTGEDGPVKGMSVNYTTTDGAEAKRVFEALAKGGQVTMPLAETFWSPKFGMCVDEFSVPWMVNVEAPGGGVLTATTTGLRGPAAPARVRFEFRSATME